MKLCRLISLAFAAMVMSSVSLISHAQDNSTADTQAPIRLEATIRGNKEQPSVLSIVPWQLPKHRTIEGALSWQPSVSEIQPIDRKRFLRKLSVSRAFNDRQVNEQ